MLHTKEIRHQHLILERMLRTQRHRWLRSLDQSLESSLQALCFAPFNLLLNMIEERHDIAETVLNVNVAVSDGDEQDLDFLWQGREGEKDGEDVVDALKGISRG